MLLMVGLGVGLGEQFPANCTFAGFSGSFRHRTALIRRRRMPENTLTQPLTGNLVRNLAAECGFDLAGVASAFPAPDFRRFAGWAERGLAGEMTYLTDHRAEIRGDPSR